MAITIREDGKVCAVAGWDGQIQLYATRTLKPLGSLKYHKSGCQCVEFARRISYAVTSDDEHESDDELDRADKLGRARWLAAGGKEQRVSVWELMNFESGNK